MRTATFLFLLISLLNSNSFSQNYKSKLEEIHQNVHLIILQDKGLEQYQQDLMKKFDLSSLPAKNKGHFDTIKISLDSLKVDDYLSFNDALEKLDTLIKRKFIVKGDQNRSYALWLVSRYINSNKIPADTDGAEPDTSKTGGQNTVSGFDSSYFFYFGIFVVICFMILFYLFFKIHYKMGMINTQMVNISRGVDASKGGGVRAGDLNTFRSDFIQFKRDDLPAMFRGVNDQLLRLDAKLEQFRNPNSNPNTIGVTNPVSTPTNIYYTDQLIDPKGWSKSSLSTTSGLYRIEFNKNSNRGTITLNMPQVTSAVLNNPFQSFPTSLCDYPSQNFDSFTKVNVKRPGTVSDDGDFIRIIDKIQLDLIK